MCASCISLLLIIISYVLIMGTDGLPISRRELGAQQDIIAGADFLSVLMQSPALRQAYKELSTTEMPIITRLGRSTPLLDNADLTQITTNQFIDTAEEKSFVIPASYITTDRSVQTSLDVKSSEISSHTIKVPQKLELYKVEVTTPTGENSVLKDNPHPLSEANKNRLSVEDGKQITFSDYLPEYSRKVESLTNSNQGVTRSQSFIYHSTPVQPDNDRPISYSTVIQALPKQRPINWNDDNQLQPHGERKERHYDINNTSNENKIEKSEHKYKNRQSLWEKPEPLYTSTEKNWETPETNYGTPEKPYSTPSTTPSTKHFPIIYSKPEENYEVDEAVSVMSSGRAHGVQSSNKNDNQKVGYVVEGRNYRKYRVEERTSDGFIVGEYGVVSHNDGSLRGVRYTADGTINPRIVYDALMTFLSL